MSWNYFQGGSLMMMVMSSFSMVLSPRGRGLVVVGSVVAQSLARVRAIARAAAAEEAAASAAAAAARVVMDFFSQSISMLWLLMPVRVGWMRLMVGPGRVRCFSPKDCG